MIFEDLRTAWRKDPALRGAHAVEVLLYPGLWAIWAHRVAHRLHRLGMPLVPRFLSQVSRAATGIEIHPGAVIGRRCFIDHGMGVVIGETAVLGDDVMLYHRVTLGGTGWWAAPVAGGRRHPVVGDRVVLGVGSTVLGPVRVGHDSVVGAHALVVRDVPAHSTVRAALPDTITRVPDAPRPLDEGPSSENEDEHDGDSSLHHGADRPNPAGGAVPVR
ncbi:serine O-acetyltransferase EpsC [Streptomyces sp. NPDC008313]|uniref:serine O-acetyltransferase EpsC n=1 Tax=Streptomyces sp. NPDC008313 TaxID=3364826 RepID=UPI0036E69317